MFPETTENVLLRNLSIYMDRVNELETQLERAGSEAAGITPRLQALPELASPALCGGLPEHPGPGPGRPSCNFCNRAASVTYRYGVGIDVDYCGRHALESLGDFAAVAFTSMELA
jgi:hypothetical protein